MKFPSEQNAPSAQLLPHTYSMYYLQARHQLLMWLSLSGKNIPNDNNDDNHHMLEVADFVYLSWHTGFFVCKSHLMSDPASVTVKVFSPGIFQKPLFTLPPCRTQTSIYQSIILLLSSVSIACSVELESSFFVLSRWLIRRLNLAL